MNRPERPDRRRFSRAYLVLYEEIVNKGNTVHNFLSPALNISPTDTPIQKTTPVSFSVPTAPGAYMFWCNIPGHAEAGMVGELIVQ